MLQLKRWLITLISLLVIIAGLGFVKFSQIKAAIAFGASFPESSETVEAIETRSSSWQPLLTLVGQVKAQQNVDVRNEIEGILTKVNFGSGSKVKKGDILAQLNIDTEQAQLDAIKAEIDLAKLDVKRLEGLVKVNASSKDQLDRATAQLAINKARARAVEATIAKKTLLAPFTGTTSIHDWQVGTYIQANTLLVNITGEYDAVWIDFNLPQIYANVSIGTLLKVSASGLIDEPVDATLVALNQRLNTSSRSLMARAEVLMPPKVLRPGVLVSVTFAIGAQVPAIEVPNAAIRYDSFGSFVYVLNKDDKDNYRASRVAVKVIGKEVSTSFVSQGLEQGEIVATVGSAKLSPNMLTFVTE